MINKKTKGGLGREFFPCGAAVWIPVALFVLLVLFQMVPLPAGVLKVVSPATYELYEETGFRERQRSEVGSPKSEGQGTDEHRTSNVQHRTSNIE